MSNYQQYSTAIKVYYSLGIQDSMIDKSIRDQIPKSTTTAWKQYNQKPIIGLELEKDLPMHLKELDVIYHPTAKIPRQAFVACMQFVLLLSSIIGKQQLRKTFRKNKHQFINFLEQYSELFSYEAIAEILAISTKTLYNWKQHVAFKCEASAVFKCVKRHPNQATIQEVNVIKEWLSKPEYQHWGIHSIWAVAFKQGLTHLSKQTWSHYNKIGNIRPKRRKGRKSTSVEPLRASKIHQIWHADITVFKTLDGMKYYIYTVMDNFSRYILSWRIEPVVSAKIRLETIQQAIQIAFGTKDFSDLQLVTDGGPENDNQTLRSFMNLNSASMRHDIALRDIRQSNSMMEAFYYITKYTCLYLHKIHNYDELLRIFQNWINEYHLEKPHYALGIYTPAEILNGADKYQKFEQRQKQAAIDRREFNQACPDSSGNANCSLNCH